jgi:hypothetical protein
MDQLINFKNKPITDEENVTLNAIQNSTNKICALYAIRFRDFFNQFFDSWQGNGLEYTDNFGIETYGYSEDFAIFLAEFKNNIANYTKGDICNEVEYINSTGTLYFKHVNGSSHISSQLLIDTFCTMHDCCTLLNISYDHLPHC